MMDATLKARVQDIHFRHIGMVLFELRASMASPYWQFFIYGELQPFRHKQLTAGDR